MPLNRVFLLIFYNIFSLQMQNKKARNIRNISSLLNYSKIHLKLLAGIEPATSTLPR